MNNFPSFLEPIVAAIRQRLLEKYSPDNGELRKVTLMYGLTLIGIFFLFLLGGVACIQGGLLLAAVDFLVGLILAVLLVLLWCTRCHNICIYTGITVMYCFLLYLVVTGGIAGTAFLWSYTAPLFTFFLLGARKGFLVSFSYFIACAAIMLVDINTSLINLYDANLAMRFIPSFGVVLLFSLLYELFRSGSQKGLIEAKRNLEQKVAERTRELAREVEEKDRAQTSAMQAIEEWKRTFDAVPDLIAILDEQYRIVRANRAMGEALNIPVDRLVQQTCYRVVHGTDAPPSCCPHAQLLQDHQAHTVEFFDDHMQRYLSVTASPLQNGKGRLTGAVHVIRDITRQKRAEMENEEAREQLRKSEKMEAIGLMAGGVAHDLNNILSGLVGYPEMLLEELPDDSSQREAIAIIKESGERAAAVVADLLTVARGAASVKEPRNLNILIQEYLRSPECMKLKACYPGIIVHHKPMAGDSRILCSPVHIKKCIMNLVTNAAEAIGESGIISITTSNRYIDEPVSSKNRLKLEPGDYVVLVIKDNGSGIQPADLEHIFDLFYTRKVMGRSGSGLGLTVVWNTVQDHNGLITVESSSRGTCFELYFPACREESTLQITGVTAGDLAGSGESILVVDDEPLLRNLADRMLRSLDYRTSMVSSGEEAIEFVKNKQVDLIVLDMLMEPGINGRQTYEEILRLVPGQKAVVASGFSESDDVRATLQLGAGGFIKKPYTKERLGRAVKEALAE